MGPQDTKNLLYRKEYCDDGKEEEWKKSLPALYLTEGYYLEQIYFQKIKQQENNFSKM